MEQKPGNKLICRKSHDFLFIVVGSVQVGESDIIFTNGLDPVITDSNLVGISCQIFQYSIGIVKGVFDM